MLSQTSTNLIKTSNLRCRKWSNLVNARLHPRTCKKSETLPALIDITPIHYVSKTRKTYNYMGVGLMTNIRVFTYLWMLAQTLPKTTTGVSLKKTLMILLRTIFSMVWVKIQKLISMLHKEILVNTEIWMESSFLPSRKSNLYSTLLGRCISRPVRMNRLSYMN